MVDILVRLKLLNSYHHGFLKAMSCLSIMLCFLEEITKWIDEGSPVDVIYLGFHKTFEKVPHQILSVVRVPQSIACPLSDYTRPFIIVPQCCVYLSHSGYPRPVVPVWQSRVYLSSIRLPPSSCPYMAVQRLHVPYLAIPVRQSGSSCPSSAVRRPDIPGPAVHSPTLCR